jgi:voltage-gated potassium channel
MDETSAKSGALIGLSLLTGLLVVGTVGFTVIEGWALVDSFYMTVITISTVGYSEPADMGTSGRMFAVALIMAGLLLTAYTFTKVGQALVESELLQVMGRRRMQREYDNLSDHYIVCGMGRIGEVVVDGLQRENHPFVVVDSDPELQHDLTERKVVYAIGDALDEDLLTRLGIHRAKAVMALLPSDADNLYLVMTAKELAPDVTAIARAMDDKAAAHLRRGGADRVISTYRIAGTRVLHAALRPAILDFTDLWSQKSREELDLEEVPVTADSPWIGKSLKEMDVRVAYGVIVVAIRRGGNVTFNPEPSQTLEADDHLIVIGTSAQVRTLNGACHATVDA